MKAKERNSTSEGRHLTQSAPSFGWESKRGAFEQVSPSRARGNVRQTRLQLHGLRDFGCLGTGDEAPASLSGPSCTSRLRGGTGGTLGPGNPDGSVPSSAWKAPSFLWSPGKTKRAQAKAPGAQPGFAAGAVQRLWGMRNGVESLGTAGTQSLCGSRMGQGPRDPGTGTHRDPNPPGEPAADGIQLSKTRPEALPAPGVTRGNSSPCRPPPHPIPGEKGDVHPSEIPKKAGMWLLGTRIGGGHGSVT